MTSFSLAAAAERFGGTILNPDVMFDAISIDSRSINAGDLFFAIQGPNYKNLAAKRKITFLDNLITD